MSPCNIGVLSWNIGSVLEFIRNRIRTKLRQGCHPVPTHRRLSCNIGLIMIFNMGPTVLNFMFEITLAFNIFPMLVTNIGSIFVYT